jgi:hypothetical protein
MNEVALFNLPNVVAFIKNKGASHRAVKISELLKNEEMLDLLFAKEKAVAEQLIDIALKGSPADAQRMRAYIMTNQRAYLPLVAVKKALAPLARVPAMPKARPSSPKPIAETVATIATAAISSKPPAPKPLVSQAPKPAKRRQRKPKNAPCPPGQERNPKTKRCKKTTLAPCPPGQERNPKTNRCRKLSKDI